MASAGQRSAVAELQAQFRKLLPAGYLSGEPADGTPPWPTRSARSGTRRDTADQVVAAAATIESWRFLDAMLGEALEGVTVAELLPALEQWTRTDLSENGFFRPAPAETQTLVPAFWRMREAARRLAARAWTKALEAAWRRLTAAAAASRDWPDADWRRFVRVAVDPLDPLPAQADEAAGLAFLADPPQPAAGTTTRRGRGGQWPRLLVDWRRDLRLLFTLEEATGAETVLAGSLETTASLGPQTLEPADDWQMVCWNSDDDGHYLELTQEWSRGTRLERQLYFAPSARFWLLADTLVGPANRPEPALQLVHHWPLHRPAAWAVSDDGDRLFRPNPSGSAAETAGPALQLLDTGNVLDGSGPMIAVRQAAVATRLCSAAVWLWSDPSRAAKQRQPEEAAASPPAPSRGRRLTITADRAVVGPETAIACRFPHRPHGVTTQQYVFFRAQQPPGRFAFLGYQTEYESVVGRLDEKGTLQEMLMVECP